jgi:hypothetical protein
MGEACSMKRGKRNIYKSWYEKIKEKDYHVDFIVDGIKK